MTVVSPNGNSNNRHAYSGIAPEADSSSCIHRDGDTRWTLSSSSSRQNRPKQLTGSIRHRVLLVSLFSLLVYGVLSLGFLLDGADDGRKPSVWSFLAAHVLGWEKKSSPRQHRRPGSDHVSLLPETATSSRVRKNNETIESNVEKKEEHDEGDTDDDDDDEEEDDENNNNDDVEAAGEVNDVEEGDNDDAGEIEDAKEEDDLGVEEENEDDVEEIEDEDDMKEIEDENEDEDDYIGDENEDEDIEDREEDVEDVEDTEEEEKDDETDEEEDVEDDDEGNDEGSEEGEGKEKAVDEGVEEQEDKPDANEDLEGYEIENEEFEGEGEGTSQEEGGDDEGGAANGPARNEKWSRDTEKAERDWEWEIVDLDEIETGGAGVPEQPIATDGETTTEARTSHSHEKPFSWSEGFVKKEAKQQEISDLSTPRKSHRISGLTCEDHGGPSGRDKNVQQVMKEMVYWHGIPSDSKFILSKYVGTALQESKKKTKRRYLTFENHPFGGWNHARQVFENAVVLAVALGRTLVLPARSAFESNQTALYKDIFPLEAMAREQEGFEMISMEEFLRREGLRGNLRVSKIKDNTTATGNRAVFPPHNRTDWTDPDGSKLGSLFGYLRAVSFTPNWRPDQCILAFPAAEDDKGAKKGRRRLNKMLFEISHNTKSADGVKVSTSRFQHFVGRPTHVNGSPKSRMLEFLAGRRHFCSFDTDRFRTSTVVHMTNSNKEKSSLFLPFYALSFFEDWHHDLWVKRFIRDHLRYTDEIQCAAARIIVQLRRRAENDVYDSLHIRRGKLFVSNFKETRATIKGVVDAIKDKIPEKTTLYVATDELDKSVFRPLAEKYDLVFLRDFAEELQGVDPKYHGMIEQVVAAHGRTFFGTAPSSFSSYINRLRGYLSQRWRWAGWQQGVLPSYYIQPSAIRHSMKRNYMPLHKMFWVREFPIGWRRIDYDVHQRSLKLSSIATTARS